MKCKNCGASLRITDKFCPSCGMPNEQSVQHIRDMEKYQKEFDATKQEVKQNSKWFYKYITPLTILVLTMAIALVTIILNANYTAYDMAENTVKNKMIENQPQVKERLTDLLDEGNFYAVGLIGVKLNIYIDSSERQYWLRFSNAARDYQDVRDAVLSFYDDKSESYIRDNFLSRAANGIFQTEESLHPKYNSTPLSEVQEQYMNRLEEEMETFLMAYCNLTEEDILLLPQKDQTSLIALLTRRMFQDE